MGLRVGNGVEGLDQRLVCRHSVHQASRRSPVARSDASFQTVTPSLLLPLRSAIVGDIEADGYAELAVPCYDASYITIYSYGP